MSTAVERAAEIIQREMGGCHCAHPYPLVTGRKDPDCAWHQHGEGLAELLAGAGIIPDGDGDTRIEYGVRFPTVSGADEIVPRPEPSARRAVDYHNNPANKSAWIGEVWLVWRIVATTAWTEVQP